MTQSLKQESSAVLLSEMPDFQQVLVLKNIQQIFFS